ncbi:MAG: polyhydroxyalkanoic acid synthase [Burkholderiales bacterium]|nr:polyhydroxyalkanoic acid synthase [Burkholderiales bacterium]
MTTRKKTATPPQTEETPTQRLDRLTHATIAPLTGGLSPVSLALAMADWGWHLGVSPGRQLELAALAAQLAKDTLLADGKVPDDAGTADDDPRFRHEAWAQWPFSQLRTGFRNTEAFWREAARVPGMTTHHVDMTQFFARQWLGMMAPANWLPTNPVVLKDVVESKGRHLMAGAQNWLRDVTGIHTPEELAQTDHFRFGQDVAVTPGKVVFRNRLIELIRYDAQTSKVHPEPVLIIPSWIMKYYILDLSPHNSMVRYLVEQGHTVYMVSWRNPDASDHDLTMDDYLHMGVIDALHAVGALSGTRHGVHAMGYCLGGTLLAIAAALGRRGGMSEYSHMPTVRTLTLLAAQTDFSEPGELGLFIDESQVGFLDNITRGKGYLTGEQMAGSFQFLHSRDLLWTRRMREYLMGEREQPNDLMAWNADTTRMPARMHHEYLTSLYLHNALANGTYRVRGRAVSLGDIHMPVFLVGTQRDHVSPWPSVYKLHHLCDAEITFVLTSGGHNAGIVSEPGHPKRSYQIETRPEHGSWVDHTQWAAQAPSHEGSWWTAWHAWLAAHSGHKVTPPKLAASAVLCNAPGEYVMQRYTD